MSKKSILVCGLVIAACGGTEESLELHVASRGVQPNAIGCFYEGEYELARSLDEAEVRALGLRFGASGVEELGILCPPGWDQMAIATGFSATSIRGLTEGGGGGSGYGSLLQSVVLGQVGDPVPPGFSSYCHFKGTWDEMDNDDGYRLTATCGTTPFCFPQPAIWQPGGLPQQYLAWYKTSSGDDIAVIAAVRAGVIRMRSREEYCDSIFE